MAWSPQTEEVESKIASVREMMARRKLAAVLITQRYNVAWLTAGGDNLVLYDSQDSLIGILLTPRRAVVIAENGDHDRVAAEEFTHCPFEYKRIWWCSGGVPAAVPGMVKGTIGVDSPVPTMPKQESVADDLALLRQVLLPQEARRLRVFGREASSIISDVARTAEPGIRERELAARLAAQFLLWGFSVAVILIGGDERSMSYRHQVASDRRIRKHFSLCGVGRKGGLTFPINRVVSFGPPPEELLENNQRIEQVFVHLNSLARAGTSLQSIYRELPSIFAAAGLEAGEWMRHSIGGTMGYQPREQVVAEGAAYTLREGNVIGWNPSLPGVMSEDVYLLSGAGLEFVSCDTRWPSRKVTANGLTQLRPEVLVL